MISGPPCTKPASGAAAPCRDGAPGGALPIARRRTRPAYSWQTGGLGGGALAVYVLVWLRLGHTEAAGSDFSASYIAARGWRSGGTGLYDQAAQLALHRQIVPGFAIDLPFVTPPTTALLAAPATLLGIDTAFRLVSALEVLLVLASVVLALRFAPQHAGARSTLHPVAITLASMGGVGTCVLLWQGQWDGLCALGLAIAYAAWRRDRPLLAGAAIALGFGATKPHLALGLVVFVLATRRLPALAGLVMGAAVVLLAGMTVAGPGGWVDWLGALRLSAGHSPPASLLGFSGLFGSWLGDRTAAAALAAAASLAALGGCAVLGHRVRRDRREGVFETALAGAAVLSLVAAPHLLAHDLAVLAVPAAWMLAWAPSGARFRAVVMSWTLLNAAALLDLGQSGQGPPGRLVPLALTAIGVAALRGTRRTAAEPLPSRPAPARPADHSGSAIGGLADQM